MAVRLGIIGGMGSQAAAHFFARVVALTPAGKDQEHLEIFLHNNSQVPDRTAAILRNGPDAFPELVRSARILDRLGVGYIAIPCMTSHYYLPRLRQEVKTTIIDAIQETCAYLAEAFPRLQRIGVMATAGTLKTGLFQKAIEARGRKALTPLEDDIEQRIMRSIYMERGIKAGYTRGQPRRLLLAAARALRQRGAQALILGCTEIPLVLREGDLDVPLVDAMEVLARRAVAACLGGVAEKGERRRPARLPGGAIGRRSQEVRPKEVPATCGRKP